MQIEVRTFAGQPREYMQAVERAFSGHLTDADAAAWERNFDAERSLAAYDGDQLVGTASALSFELTVPGSTAPAAGVTMVGVQPTHRRRGILRDMMRRQLDDVRQRGEPLAVLWASEGGIYQRFGYGLASLMARMSIQRHRSAFRTSHEPMGPVRFVDENAAKRELPPIYEAIRPRVPGFFGRSPGYWEAEIFHMPEHWRRGRGPTFYVVHDGPHGADGYARYAIREKDDGREISLYEIQAARPDAARDLWRFLLDVDLIGTVAADNLAVDDPLLLTVAEPRKLGWTVSDALWLRIVDVPGALAARRYAASGSISFELRDEFCPWNAGRWALTCEGPHGSAVATPDDPELTLDTTDLAAVYLGAFSFGQLLAAGRIEERVPGAAESADAMFRTSRRPWCPGFF